MEEDAKKEPFLVRMIKAAGLAPKEEEEDGEDEEDDEDEDDEDDGGSAPQITNGPGGTGGAGGGAGGTGTDGTKKKKQAIVVRNENGEIVDLQTGEALVVEDKEPEPEPEPDTLFNPEVRGVLFRVTLVCRSRRWHGR